MEAKKCEICGCGFRPDGDENRCKAHKDVVLTEKQKIKLGQAIPISRERWTEEKIRAIVKDEISKYESIAIATSDGSDENVTIEGDKN